MIISVASTIQHEIQRKHVFNNVDHNFTRNEDSTEKKRKCLSNDYFSQSLCHFKSLLS